MRDWLKIYFFWQFGSSNLHCCVLFLHLHILVASHILLYGLLISFISHLTTHASVIQMEVFATVMRPEL